VAGAYVTDMRHYLDESGRLGDMPGPAFNLARYFGSIVAWVTTVPVGGLLGRMCRAVVSHRPTSLPPSPRRKDMVGTDHHGRRQPIPSSYPFVTM
jgi:hypothetical protein